MLQKLNLAFFVTHKKEILIGVIAGSIALVVLIGSLAITSTNLFDKNEGQPASITKAAPTTKNPTSSQSRGPAAAGKCPDGPLFNHMPMELSSFRAFRPLGFFTLPTHIFGTKHSNFAINLPGESIKGLPVEFPSDAVVTQIVATESDKSKGYQVVFFPCDNFKSYFFHLGMLGPRLEEKMKGVGQSSCKDFNFGTEKIKKCELKTELRVSSGELAGLSDGFGGVDFGAVDYRLPPADYANPKRYDGDYPYYTSPVLYFTPELRAKLEDKLRSIDGKVKRTAEPRVGTLLQDVKGTAQGNWFIGDKSFMNTDDLSPFLALAHDYIDPAQPIFSMGTSVKGLASGLYSFTPTASGTINRDFKDVKSDGQTYCYEKFPAGPTAGGQGLTQPGGVIIMAMPSGTQLKVEFKAGTCATVDQTFTQNATMFER